MYAIRETVSLAIGNAREIKVNGAYTKAFTSVPLDQDFRAYYAVKIYDLLIAGELVYLKNGTTITPTNQ